VYEPRNSAVIPSGTILRQSLQSGDYPFGTTVTLTVARGLKQVKVPPDKAVVGQSIGSVRDLLTAAGFFINPVIQFSDTVPNSLVITTDPAPGTLQPAGSTITLFISEVLPPSSPTWFSEPRAQRSPSSRPPISTSGPSGHDFRLPAALCDGPVLGSGSQVKRGTTVVISVKQPISTTTTTTTTTPSVSGISGITG